MLTFFFIIVFIAEVIITVQAVSFLRKWDRKVCAINNLTVEITPDLKEIITSVRIILNNALLNINKTKIKLEEKKNELTSLILKNLIIGLVFLILNTNGKRIITAVELAFSLKDFVSACLKAADSLKN